MQVLYQEAGLYVKLLKTTAELSVSQKTTASAIEQVGSGT